MHHIPQDRYTRHEVTAFRAGSPSGRTLCEARYGLCGNPSPRRNVCKVFIRFGLGLDLGFCGLGKVLILLGFDVGDVGKVFISNK
jgi:hypothetical protein